MLVKLNCSNDTRNKTKFTENVEAAVASLPHIFDLAFSLRIWSDLMVEGPNISTVRPLSETLVSVMFFEVVLEVNLFLTDTETA